MQEPAPQAPAARDAARDHGDVVLRCRGLTRRYGEVVAVDDLDLEVARGELLGILGPSGCGKTTALRLVAGLDQPDVGTVEIRGRVVAAPGQHVPPEQRHVGMVFQDYALFPHLSVAANVGYGLRRREDREQRVASALELVGLGHVADRRPARLSGGQQQRVALARALAPGPDIVLLDEPFSNLDAALRDTVRREVRDILKRAGATALFVTHDQEEALSLADRIAVLQAGRLHQVADPATLYSAPRTRFVAEFVGDADVVDGTRAGRFLLDTPLGRLASIAPLESAEHAAVVRPEAVQVSTVGEANATVRDVTYYGHDQLLALSLDTGPDVRARTGPHLRLDRGARVRVELNQKVVTFPR